MRNLSNEKEIEYSQKKINIFDIIHVHEKDNNMERGNNYNKFSLSRKIYTNKLDRNIDDLRDIEFELTPNAKKYTKVVLSPIASISYILQESSIAFGKVVAATISFIIFGFINCISQASISAYEIKLPLISICLMGGILGARDLVKSIKKIILSVPTGIKKCYENITFEDCSILDFICGIDKRNENIIKKMSKKLF